MNQEPNGRVVAPAVEAMLRDHTASRSRVVDDHMFMVPFGRRPASLRLQVFTAPDALPVMVAIQTEGEGPSLTNAAETYVEAARKRFFPEGPSPLWIQRYDFPDLFDGFSLVTFPPDGGPEWWTVPDEWMARLVGGPVDRDRGAGFVPCPPEPEQVDEFTVARVATLPRPTTCRTEGCMPANGITRLARTLRQLRPDPTARACCWYHGGSWEAVNQAAIGFLRQARAEGVARDEVGRRILALAELAGLPEWEHEALYSLVREPIFPVGKGPIHFVNGCHRSQAMLDQGVRHALVQHAVDAPDRAELQAAYDAWMDVYAQTPRASNNMASTRANATEHA
ncbi:hypothetical protein GCM10027589_04300 [Actinocorallia lasiicapitis]